MNIFQMYYHNNKQFGFWVVRNSWGKSLAKIISIEGVTEGEEIRGKKPYHNDANYQSPKVMAEFYKLVGDNQYEYQKVIELNCPNTYAYEMFNDGVVKEE